MEARSGETSITHGLTAALEALTECSEGQVEKLKLQTDSNVKVAIYIFIV